MALKKRLIMVVFSKTSDECLQCAHFNDCDKKRLVACAMKELPTQIAAKAAESVSMPLVEDLAVKHDYRNIKVDENTTVTIDLEDLKRQMEKDFYKSLGCSFMEC